MAVVWIENIKNFSETADLKIRHIDNGRRPKFVKNGQTLTTDWFSVERTQTPGVANVAKCENFAVPWNGSDDLTGVWAQWSSTTIVTHQDKQFTPSVTATARLDIFPDFDWDYIRIRDGEGSMIDRLDAGSLGDARGTNWSLYELVLHKDNTLGLNCTWRQGGTRQNAKAVGDIVLSIGVAVLAAAATVIGAGIGLAGNDTNEAPKFSAELKSTKKDAR
jgi:hypothetical protein